MLPRTKMINIKAQGPPSIFKGVPREKGMMCSTNRRMIMGIQNKLQVNGSLDNHEEILVSKG
jgi:hypothetical protein